MAKTFMITIKMRVSDDFFENEGKKLKNEILSGEFQRDFIDSDNHKKERVLSCKATFEVLKS